ncbi:Mfs general substrate transporter [Pleurostoma richardsiae]|uniref:Mfs general substrate transporter n=1 Tax=Pleurostoma richardsiae TaxID=41990 RepID=A0AA38VF30_9PEZI|nr:Mfs general substrate transporter [Pleurostoma richardsiae]
MAWSAEAAEPGAASSPPLAALDDVGGSTPGQSLPPPIPYTVFSKWQKRYLTYLLGYLCLASSLTATIYFPLISLLAQQYHTSVQAINLTITLYIVFQGLAPSFWSPLSDILGRRPVFLGTFAVYTAASLGLAFSDRSYVALALLRAAQSIGGSAVLSISYGVVADVSTHAERGSMLGPMLASGNLGPCLGPVIGGGAILASGQPRWCFWVLVIFGGVAVSLVGWTFPETRRTVVGNGAVPAEGIWRTWWAVSVQCLRRRRGRSATSGTVEKKDGDGKRQEATLASNGDADEKGAAHHQPGPDPDDVNACASGRGKLAIPNPFSSLRLIFFWDTFLILFLAASPYAVWYLVQTSIPVIYGRVPGGYGFNDLYVGLCYLAGGSGVIAGGVIAGRLMDWNYRHVARRAGFPTDGQAYHNIRDFPIEEARSRGSITILLVSVCAIVGFGWAVQRKVHPAVPLILQCYIGAKCTVLHQVFSALLVDIFPDKTGTAAASNNITRCALSAAVVAALQPLVSAMGRAWFFTLVALLDGGLCVMSVLILRRWGKAWRHKRKM